MKTQEPKTKLQQFVCLLPAIAVLTIGGIFLFNVTDLRSVTGRPLVDMLFVMAALNLCFYLAIRIRSGLSSRTQILMLGSCIAIQAICLASLKLDGLYGDGRPVIGWRFSSPPKLDLATEDLNDRSDDQLTNIETVAFDWPSFRGPLRNGVVKRKLVNWNLQKPIELWRKPIGEGWSSFVTSGDYCFTQEQRGNREVVVCRETRSGKEQWIHFDIARFEEVSGGNGPRATPSIFEGKLYSIGATGILNCLDATNGSRIWSVNVLTDNEAENLLFGVTSSPLVHDDYCIVCAGGPSASLVAYNRMTGDKVWSAGSAKASYSSPQLFELCSTKQVLIYNAEGLDGHDLITGELLWHIPWTNQSPDGTNVCQPILVGEDRIFISSGYEAGSAVYRIERSENEYEWSEAWKSRFLKSKFASAVLHDGFIYGLDNGILVCIDAASGERQWKGGRMGHGQLLLVGDKILIQTEKGDVIIIDTNPESFSEVSRLSATSRRTWTVPTIAGNHLLIRNDREAVCFNIEFEEE